MLQPLRAAQRLNQVRYDIRGPLHARAGELEAQGHAITRLHIGNPALFGFEAPPHLRAAMRELLPQAEAYCHQQGLIEAREAVTRVQQARQVPGAHPDHVFIGNGVSELIDLSLRALVEPGDEVLVPAPDYPLWTAAVMLNGGQPIHYPCPPERGGLPDPDEIEALITPRTRALVLINPNNPTGAVYSGELLQRLVRLAERFGLVIFSDEIYEGLLYEGEQFHPVAPMVHDTLCVTLSGLSKAHRACGYRAGWLVVSGLLRPAQPFLRGLNLLAALRLCSNVPAQWAVVAALDGPDTHSALVEPGGRLHESRAAVLEAVRDSRHLRVQAPMGAIYAFPGVDPQALPGFDDEQFAMELLERKHILIVPGSSFNVPYRNHFRITLLPEAATLRRAIAAMDEVIEEHLPSSRRAGAAA
ncbi:MAG: aminotransferase class I/II-fold pyridoxal phosphate-dependent enzyme [Xanthomonadales bacterium]|nr:aminotransferase class I/II-fold pyridoxal phosphate-dependent enzyme [Xanthomonadales bacterium]MCB1629312.1 aminotransferase class I/II-fold pyridoxal phosphate-dependent enzyme [Xanthomonadales bacterium]